MINKSTIKRFACLAAITAALVLVGGSFSEAQAQRDPFKKAGWAIPKKPVTPTTGKTSKAGPTVAVNYGPPTIEARIEYYKRLREAAVANGAMPPKVTSVLTLNEMAVTGIFKTPRGWGAMVEATPIKLSYTIYPGEKFFDGQLIAVEDNRLVFRKVTKVADGKFVASVENKPLRQYTMKAQVEGTAPTQPADNQTEVAKTPSSDKNAAADKPVTADKPTAKSAKPGSNPFLSPLDEMNNQTGKPDSGKDKAKKGDKKPPVKVAKNSGI